MSPAAEFFRNVRNVQLTFAPQADAKTSVRQLAKEKRSLHVADRKGIIHQSLAVLFLRAGAFHLLLCGPNPSQRAFAL